MVIVAVLAFGWLLFGGYRTSPLQGKLKAAPVKYFSSGATNSEGLNILEKTVTIHEPAEVAAIEKSLSSVWNYGANSMEGTE
jgi:hypothetical protein